MVIVCLERKSQQPKNNFFENQRLTLICVMRLQTLALQYWNGVSHLVSLQYLHIVILKIIPHKSQYALSKAYTTVNILIPPKI